jgi:hypothetical protein
MLKKITGLQVKSNWEFMAFYLIEQYVDKVNRGFKRTQIINDRNLGEVLSMLGDILGHKRKPEHPSETMQRTLQNMRNKGWIDFLTNQGDYRLTDAGYDILMKMKDGIRQVREAIR